MYVLTMVLSLVTNEVRSDNGDTDEKLTISRLSKSTPLALISSCTENTEATIDNITSKDPAGLGEDLNNYDSKDGGLVAVTAGTAGAHFIGFAVSLNISRYSLKIYMDSSMCKSCLTRKNSLLRSMIMMMRLD